MPRYPIRKAMPVLFDGGIRYLLRDDFTDTVAAGSVNGTPATPGPGARTVVDTENKLSIGSGLANFAPKATPAAGDPGLWYAAITRALGQIFIFRVAPTQTNKVFSLGLDTDQSGGLGGNYMSFAATGAVMVNNAVRMFNYTATDYQFAIALRATGAFHFVKGGAFTDWTLIYVDNTNDTATLYPALMNNSANITADFFRHPKITYIPVPALSDGFGSAAVETVYYTDGLGMAESGGSGLAWVDTLGTWQNAAGKANADALDAGGSAVRLATLTKSDVFLSVQPTRSDGNLGAIVRYIDADNYVYVYHDGTNIIVSEFVGGAENVLQTTAAVAASAARRLEIFCQGTVLRVMWNNAIVGSQLAINAALSAGLKIGLYTTNTGNTFDNLYVFPVGTGGEHNSVLNLFLA